MDGSESAPSSSEAEQEDSKAPPGPTIESVFKACQLGHLEEVEQALRDGYDPNAVDGEGIAALHWAAINNRERVVEALLKAGADVNCCGGELQSTPIYWATSQGHVGMVVMLFEKGGDPSIADSNGHNCLFLAAQLENWKLLLLCAAYGVNVDSTDKEGLTALLWVCQHRANRKELIRVLINLNASLTLTEPKNGNAALHCAVLGRGYLSSIRALLHAGANLQQKNHAGKTPADLAFDGGQNYNYVARELSNAQLEPLCGFWMLFAIPWCTIPAVFILASILTALQMLLLVGLVIGLLCVLPVGSAMGCNDDRKATIAQTAISFGVNTGSVFWIAVPYFMGFWQHLSWFANLAYLTCYFSIWYAIYKTVTVSSVVTQAKWPLSRKLKAIEQLASVGELKSSEVCPSNLIRIPMRAKYCSASQQVVARFDHHCPFVNNTVGAANHKYFIMFLVSVILTLVQHTYYGWVYFGAVVPDAQSSSVPTFVYNIFNHETFAACCCCLGIFHVLWITGLTGFQLSLVANNTTTYEHLMSYQIDRFSRGTWQNFVDFFEIDLFGIKCEHIDWSNVYTWPPPPPSAAEDENV